MTFTYASDLSTNLAKVRHLLQDNDSKRPLLQDAEIQFHLTNNSSDIFSTAADAALAIAAKLGRKFSRSAIDVNDDPQAVAQFYLSMAAQYAQKRNVILDIFAGGRTVSGKEDLAADADATQPAFGIGQDDHATDQNSSSGNWDDE